MRRETYQWLIPCVSSSRLFICFSCVKVLVKNSMLSAMRFAVDNTPSRR